MFKLSESAMRVLRDKYPNLDMAEIVDTILTTIYETTVSEGACILYNLGRFYTYKNYSERKNKFVPRFKFKVSRSLVTKMESDQYVINQINTVAKTLVNENVSVNPKYIQRRTEKQNEQRLIRDNSLKLRENAKVNLMHQEVKDIFGGVKNEEDISEEY